jgi:hypothetical protein
MAKKRIAVIFDTNSYRSFVRGKTFKEVIDVAEKLSEKENSRDIKSLASVIVLVEMVANLAEGKEGFNYDECLKGIIAMSHHCFDHTEQGPRIIPQANLLIAKSFFNKLPPQAEENAKNLGGLLNDFKNDSAKAIEHYNKQSAFDNYKKYVENLEIEFSQQIINLIEGIKTEIRRDSPNISSKHLREKTMSFIESEQFNNTMSIAILTTLSTKMGLNYSQSELTNMSSFLIKKFPSASGFFKWICHEIVDKNIDLNSKTSKEKRWNWIWDYNVSFSVSNSTVQGRDMILVTSDKDLKQMLTDNGFGVRVMKLDEYLDFIEFN